jgi:hypothetical protein
VDGLKAIFGGIANGEVRIKNNRQYIKEGERKSFVYIDIKMVNPGSTKNIDRCDLAEGNLPKNVVYKSITI